MKVMSVHCIQKSSPSLLRHTRLLIGILVLLCSSSVPLPAQGVATGTRATLTPRDYEDFRQQAIKSVGDFTTYVSNIINKESDADRKNQNAKLGLLLFAAPDSDIIEITNLNPDQPVTTRVIRDYFTRLKTISFKNVKITWFDTYISDNFILAEDGKYYGLASICQRFDYSGSAQNSEFATQIKGSNVTCKTIQLVVSKSELRAGDTKTVQWTLKLGDIKVDEQRF